MTEYTLVGRVINTHGIKGGLRVYPYTFDINRFYEYEKVYLGQDKLELNIVETSIHKGLAILYFDGYEDINDVLDLKEENLYIKRDQEAVLEEGSYYIDDLIGCKVYEKDELIGQVTSVYKGLANDVYEVSGPKGSYSIPAVSVFIKDVDIKAQKIQVDLIDGMLNED